MKLETLAKAMDISDRIDKATTELAKLEFIESSKDVVALSGGI